MPQITIYLDEPTTKKMEAAVRKAGISKSRWIADAVRSKCSNEWPQEVLDLFGAWKDEDFPTLEEIRATYGKDAPREPF